MSNDSWRTPDDLFEILDKGGIYQDIHFEGFHFDIDLCANEENTKCNQYYYDYLNNKDSAICFSNELREIKCAFMNPPYSNPKPFIEKAWSDSRFCKIVCLVKVDPSTKWWATFWEYEQYDFRCGCCGSSKIIGKHLTYYRCLNCDSNALWGSARRKQPGPKPGCDVIFFPKRIKFNPPKELDLTCKKCKGTGEKREHDTYYVCTKCDGIGKKKLSGPSFPSCLLVFDRRGL